MNHQCSDERLLLLDGGLRQRAFLRRKIESLKMDLLPGLIRGPRQVCRGGVQLGLLIIITCDFRLRAKFSSHSRVGDGTSSIGPELHTITTTNPGVGTSDTWPPRRYGREILLNSP